MVLLKNKQRTHNQVLVGCRTTNPWLGVLLRVQTGANHLDCSLFRRYYFLGFGFKDNVPATRESCRLLLVRLHMDGWALGKTKVFLKYYHVEYLAKLYEEQVGSLHSMILILIKVRQVSRLKNKTKIFESIPFSLRTIPNVLTPT